MNFTLVSGSPRLQSNTRDMLRIVAEELTPRHRVDFLDLREYSISGCDGCLACELAKRCVIRDDMTGIYDILRGSDVILLATPTYFGNVSGLLKNFMDRTNPLYWDRALKGKGGASLVTEDT